MKVAHAENNVLGSSGLQQTQGFNIRASAHAFKILSSGLYSDKVRAVLREIGCNAHDAHVAAGCPQRPFRVKVPNTLDDQFYVQDWGPGLSHEAVMELYTTYFASTKQTSNDFTGAFGLGSKSPFSYTDSFSVVSVHGGKKRTYSLYMGNDGVPQVSLMTEEDADVDWPSGVRVGFAVKPEHFTEFQDKSQEVYQWFVTTPEMRGRQPIAAVQYQFSCDDFHLIKDGDRGEVTALMGNVAYPVNLQECGVKTLSSQTQHELLNYVSNTEGLVLRLPIGSVEVAASRESLQYDPKSTKVLKEALRLAVRRIGKEVTTSLESAAKGGWKELCKLGEAKSMLRGVGAEWSFEPFAKAIGLDEAVYALLKPYVGKTSIAIPDACGASSQAYFARADHYRGMPTAKVNSVVKGMVLGANGTSWKGQLGIRPDTVIAAGEADRPTLRAKLAVKSGKYSQVLVITSTKTHPCDGATMRAEAESVSRRLGGLEVIDLATLDAPPRTAASAKKRKPKGWAPTLPNEEVETMNDCKLRLADLDARGDRLFACRLDKSRWGSTSSFMRDLHETVDKDYRIEWASWEAIWKSYQIVQGVAKLPGAPLDCAVVSAGEARRWYLPQLGWGNAFEAIGRYLQRPELHDELRKKIKRRHLAAAENWHSAGGWMTGLAWWWGDGMPRELTHRLKELGLDQQLSDMVAARKALRGGAPALPQSVQAYQQLCNLMKMQDQLAGDISKAVTVEDLDAAFAKRFPLAQYVGLSHALQDKSTDAALFVLSKEE